MIPQKKLAYSWQYQGSQGSSTVIFELFAEGKGTKVRLTHAGLDTFAVNNNPDLDKHNFVEGWNSILGTSLKQFVGSKEQHGEDNSDREIVTSRLLDAPRELVWKVWTDPKHIEKWWGPNGFTTTTTEMEVKVGGRWLHIMHGPDGTDYPNEIIYEELTKPERIIYLHGGGEGSDDAQFRSSITFEDQGGKTLLTMRALFPTAAQRDLVIKNYGAIEGGKQTLARLNDYLTTKMNA